jgi:hypothetical protein
LTSMQRWGCAGRESEVRYTYEHWHPVGTESRIQESHIQEFWAEP